MADFAITNDFSSGTTAVSSEVNANFTQIESIVNGRSAVGTPYEYGMAPIGSVMAWLKTFIEKTSTGGQTNTSTGTNQLIDSAADFVSDGVTAGMIVHNEDDDEFAIVETVTDLNTLVLVNDINGGSSDKTTFDGGTAINYAIYATPELPDNWVECNGQTLSGAYADADSPYNGGALPNLNVTQSFLRGSITSGTTGGADTVAHTHGLTTTENDSGTGGNTQVETNITQGASDANNLPVFYEMVWIMRIK